MLATIFLLVSEVYCYYIYIYIYIFILGLYRFSNCHKLMKVLDYNSLVILICGLEILVLYVLVHMVGMAFENFNPYSG